MGLFDLPAPEVTVSNEPIYSDAGRISLTGAFLTKFQSAYWLNEVDFTAGQVTYQSLTSSTPAFESSSRLDLIFVELSACDHGDLYVN